jgi:hypothetical protein
MAWRSLDRLGQQPDNCHHHARQRRYGGLGYAGGHGARVVGTGGGEGIEHLEHADHRAEQAEQRADLDQRADQ